MRERSQSFDPRQVMRREDFEVFHYRDPRPGFVEVHHHDFYEVYFLMGGNVSYWVDGRVIHMTPGDLLFINPMELHRPMPDPKDPVCERFVLWINKNYLEGLSTAQLSLTHCFDTQRPDHSHRVRPSASQRAALTGLFGTLVQEHYSKELGSEISARGVFLQLIVEMNRLSSRSERLREAEELSQLVRNAMTYIGENISQPLSLEEIAGKLFVSKYHLSHAFSGETGISLYRYVMLRRLLMARQLLAAGEPAGQVCRSCGFSDYTSFYRAFKSEYGISPRDFLNQ